MNPLKNLDRTVFAKTRAEELGDDVWESFFIPPYFDRLDFRRRTKPIAIQGGRGCGKTMLLRYLSHATTFSMRREIISDIEIEHIGLYWRIDTQFCNSMRGRGLDETEWEDAFKHYLALTITNEIIESLLSISQSKYGAFNEECFAKISFEKLKNFNQEIPAEINSFRDFIEDQLWKFQSWTSNVSQTNLKPLFLPGRSFILALIKQLKRSTPALKLACFFVYIDEFENFSDYQWRIVNDAIKHSQNPLIFNTAMKRGAVLVTETTGRESISGVNDFITVDLEDELSGDAELFFSEILLGGLEVAQGNKTTAFIQRLRDPARIQERRHESYITDIKQKVRKILPALSPKEVATEIINSPSLNKIVVEKFNKFCKERGMNITEWHPRLWIADHPEILVLLPHLLARSTVTPTVLADEVRKYAAHEPNKFENGYWIQNNLFAAELEVYRPYHRTCPLYAGFDAFCTLSKTNLRAFLSLCHRSLELSQLEDNSESSIPISIQAQGALDASTKFLREIRTCGPDGERLYGLTYRLGNLFKTLQSIPELSEPEQNQFSITSGDKMMSDADQHFLAEAVKHSILLEHRETKTKQIVSTDNVDYQLNPIYCPYFNISYRKKRKIELSTAQFIKLINGTVSDYQSLISDITVRRSKKVDSETQSLFTEE